MTQFVILKDMMMKKGFSFGYRVLDEILTFIDEVEKESFFSFHHAQTEGLLTKLFSFCLEKDPDSDLASYERAIHEDPEEDYTFCRFPRSAKKILASGIPPRVGV